MTRVGGGGEGPGFVPGSDDGIRRAWLLLRDVGATPAKGIRFLLLIAWLAYFPPRYWAWGPLQIGAPLVAALVMGFGAAWSLKSRRRAATGDVGKLRSEVATAVRMFQGGHKLLALMAVMLVLAHISLALLLLQSPRPVRIGDVGNMAVGVLITWGILETILHHRRAAVYAGIPAPGGAESPRSEAT